MIVMKKRTNLKKKKALIANFCIQNWKLVAQQ